MTLDEAIKHCEEVAERQERASSFWSKGSRHYESCLECSKEHKQLATWLRELKAYRDKPQESDNESCDAIWEKAYKEREGKKMKVYCVIREEARTDLDHVVFATTNKDDAERFARKYDFLDYDGNPNIEVLDVTESEE